MTLLANALNELKTERKQLEGRLVELIRKETDTFQQKTGVYVKDVQLVWVDLNEYGRQDKERVLIKVTVSLQYS